MPFIRATEARRARHHPRLGERAGVLAHLLTDLAEAWVNRRVIVIAELADLNTHETSRNFASPRRVRVLLDLGVHVIPRLRA